MTIGVVLLFLGVIFYNVYAGTPKGRSWWIWTLIVLGLVFTIVFALVSIILLSKSEATNIQSAD